MAFLQGIPPVKEKRFEKLILLKDKPFTIGRFDDASCLIRDVKVSRKPAVFQYDFDKQLWTLTDEKSMNGVFVNDVRIPSAEPISLNNGDIIKLGPIPDYRWIFFNDGEDCSSIAPPAKRPKLTEHIQSQIEIKMKETIEKLDEERRSLANKVTESEKAKDQLLQEKNRLLETIRLQNEELRHRQDKEREEVLSRLTEDDGIKAEQRKEELAVLEERLKNEQLEVESQSVKATEDLDRKIFVAEQKNAEVISENRKTIENLLEEKRLAEDLLAKEKQVFEAKILLLQKEFDEKSAQEETYKQNIKQITFDLEEKLKEGQTRLESVIETERREKESLKVEFEKMKAESSEVIQKLDEVMGACEEEFKCTICDEIFIKPMTANCGHVYCKFCLDRWRLKCQKSEFTCPNCRKPVLSTSKNHYLENLIESLTKRFGDKIKQEREKLVQLREDEENSSFKATHPLLRNSTSKTLDKRKNR